MSLWKCQAIWLWDCLWDVLLMINAKIKVGLPPVRREWARKGAGERRINVSYCGWMWRSDHLCQSGTWWITVADAVCQGCDHLRNQRRLPHPSAVNPQRPYRPVLLTWAQAALGETFTYISALLKNEGVRPSSWAGSFFAALPKDSL